MTGLDQQKEYGNVQRLRLHNLTSSVGLSWLGCAMIRAVAIVYLCAALVAGTVAIQSGAAVQGLLGQAAALLHR